MNSPNFNQNEIESIEAPRGVDLIGSSFSVTSIDNSQLNRLSPVALAYIGDAVYELFVRTKLLFPPKRISDYHSQVVAQVRAETQAAHLQTLEPYLTFVEQEVVRRGRNAVTNKPKRLDRQTYQQASGFETLVGYLHLTNSERLQELLTKLS